MLKDLKLELANQQTFTISSATSENTIDLGVEKSRPGANPYGAGYLNIVCVKDVAPCLTAATGTVTFSENPSANDTLTLGGTAATFVASDPTSTQIEIGETLAETLENVAAHTFANTVKLSITDDDEITVTAVTAGEDGNDIAMAKSSEAITLSGATLSGGVDANAVSLSLWHSDDNSVFSKVMSTSLTDPKVGDGVSLRIPEVKRYIRAHMAGSENITDSKWDIWVGAPLTDH